MDETRVIETIRKESVLIDRAGLISLYGAVLRLAGLGVGGVLYQAGRHAGIRGAQLLRERLGLQGEELLEAARLAFEAAGWGQARWHREGASLSIEVMGSILADGLRPQRKPICHPLAGYIAGFLEIAFQHPVRVREVACAAVEGSICQFVAELEK
ncbi:V4R domain-containing protein [Thermoflexus sp.]|uniref:V4R domain-containing protein n=1 Tax=Thermoflexus sp. TaxID=1969742 RepID=UPI0035E44122